MNVFILTELVQTHAEVAEVLTFCTQVEVQLLVLKKYS